MKETPLLFPKKFDTLKKEFSHKNLPKDRRAFAAFPAVFLRISAVALTGGLIFTIIN